MIARFINTGSVTFNYNGTPQFKVFLAVKVGNSSIKVISAYDSRLVLMPTTNISNIEIDNQTYNDVDDAIDMLKDVVFAISGTSYNDECCDENSNEIGGIKSEINDLIAVKESLQNDIVRIDDEIRVKAPISSVPAILTPVNDTLKFFNADEQELFSLNSKQFKNQATHLSKNTNGKIVLSNDYGEVLDDVDIEIPEIVDALTSTFADKTLSANQGRILYGFIQDIQDIITSDDVNLDEFQEIVNYIKQNKNDLQNLSISNIAGLQTALNGKEAAFSKNTGFNRPFGTGSNDVVRGNDSRFHEHTNKTTLDAINDAKVQEWDEKATQQDIDDSIDAVEIGGRNYISTNPENWEQGYWDANNNGVEKSSNNYIRLKDFIDVQGNETFTVSSEHRISVSEYDSLNNLVDFTNKNASTFQKTFTTQPSTIYLKIYTNKNPVSTIETDWISDKKLQLEKGNQTTDWTPAPEDKANDADVLHKTGNADKLITGNDTEKAISDFATAAQGTKADEAHSWGDFRNYGLGLENNYSPSISNGHDIKPNGFYASYGGASSNMPDRYSPMISMNRAANNAKIMVVRPGGNRGLYFFSKDSDNNVWQRAWDDSDFTQTNINEWIQAFQKKINALSVTGDSNKTITITREDGTTLTASFLDDTNPAMPDDVINTLGFNENNNGVLRAVTSEGEIITVSLDGRYALISQFDGLVAQFNALATVVDGKANTTHTHSIGQIVNLQNRLDEKALIKNIRVVSGTNPSVFPSDGIVIMTTNSIGLSTFPTAAEAGDKKEITVVAWTPQILMNNSSQLSYYDNKGDLVSKVVGAVQLKSDGTNWYQINNPVVDDSQFFGAPEELTTIHNNGTYIYSGNQPISFPNASNFEGIKIKVITRQAVQLDDFIDTDGTASTERTSTAGEVFEFLSDGTNWHKIN